MDTAQNQKPSKPKRNTDRIEVAKVLAIAVVSFLVGFGLVILFFRPTSVPDSPKFEEEPKTTVAKTMDSAQPVAGEQQTYAPTTYAPASMSPAPSTQESSPQVPSEPSANEPSKEIETSGVPDQGSAPKEVPPGKIPDGVALDGSAYYLKCWDEKGGEVPGPSCDRLDVLEKRFSTRLYVVDKCKKEQTQDKASGKLSLGLEVDFNSGTLSFWNGASSEIDGASKIAGCVRTDLAGLSIDKIDHKYSKYRIFFTVLFGAAAKAQRPKPAADEGSLVDVLKDRVRVRKTPGDGDVIGLISKGNKVKLLGRKGAWCRIMTPNNNEGWLICEALGK